MRFAIVKQKEREETGKKEWALVSKSDPSKVLKWFGTAKPSDEAVQKEERRIQHFKHKGGSDMNLRQKTIRLAHAKPELRPHLLPILKEAKRLVPEMIRTRYWEVATRRGNSSGRWILEVAGGTYDYKNELKRLGFWWDRGRTAWIIDSGREVNIDALMQYGLSDFDPSNPQQMRKVEEKNKKVAMRRQQQKKAWPIVQKMMADHNAKVQEMIQAQKEGLETQKDYVKWSQRNQRLLKQFEKAGIVLKHKFPGTYESFDPYVLVTGKTYDIKDVMKKFRFRWDSSQRGWTLPTTDFAIIGDKWKGEVVRALPQLQREEPTGGTAVFSEMSQSEYKRVVDEAADRDYDWAEGYDGETSMAEVRLMYFRKLRKLSPRDQQEAFENFQKGGLPIPKSDRRHRWRP
jgi:hypothetical protein